MPRAADLREPQLRRLPPPDAAVRLPALGWDDGGDGGPAARLGSAQPASGIPDAARRRTAGVASGVATASGMRAMDKSGRPLTIAVREIARFGADERGATAIEYAMIASGVG